MKNNNTNEKKKKKKKKEKKTKTNKCSLWLKELLEGKERKLLRMHYEIFVDSHTSHFQYR